MEKTAIIGVGMTPVGEHWDKSLRQLAYDAAAEAIQDAGNPSIDALYVSNAFGSTFNKQSHLGSLIADFLGLSGVEAYTIEAAEASGGVALRTAYLAVSSGAINTALVIGVEKPTDIVAGNRVRAGTVALDADYESPNGATLTAMAALLMRRYMYEYGVELSAFEPFSINAHTNGRANPRAMFRNTLREGAFAKAMMVADPVNLFDSAPDGDGAAAVIISRGNSDTPQPIHIAGSAVATDAFMVQDRKDLLWLRGVEASVKRALHQANVDLNAIDFMEAHDAYTILTALALESAGLAERGQGWKMADASIIGREGSFPLSTFGGLKSRGNPAGASGVYQAVEAVLQLQGRAGDNQIANPTTAMIQSIGGMGSTVATHILKI